MDYADAIAELTTTCAQRVADALRDLLERKHLYQSVRVTLGESTNVEAAAKAPKERAASVLDVPREIPRQVANYYSGAVVAHQCGQTLAGNFLLRTLIEQWGRSFPPTAEMRVEAALDWYYSHLPEDFRQRFPSLRKVYEELSSDIHAAVGDAQVFNDESAHIVKHFDAWRVYELDHATFGQSRRDSD